MSRPFSRPRTRIYDVNYNIGENYYKSTIDRLDRKYSGRPISPAPRQTSVPKDLLERHSVAFQDEDLSTSRARASKHIQESNLFDARSGSLASRAMDLMENDIDEETASKLQRIRANKKVSVIDDLDMDSTINSITSRRMKERADKILDTVGITAVDNSRRRDEDVVYKRRTLKMTMDSSDNKDLTKWSKVNADDDIAVDTAASIRAKQSRARLNEIEDEMNMMQEKAALRERRNARLRALVAENAEESNESAVASTKTMRITTRQRKEAIEY